MWFDKKLFVEVFEYTNEIIYRIVLLCIINIVHVQITVKGSGNVK